MAVIEPAPHEYPSAVGGSSGDRAGGQLAGLAPVYDERVEQAALAIAEVLDADQLETDPRDAQVVGFVHPEYLSVVLGEPVEHRRDDPGRGNAASVIGYVHSTAEARMAIDHARLLTVVLVMDTGVVTD